MACAKKGCDRFFTGCAILGLGGERTEPATAREGQCSIATLLARRDACILAIDLFYAGGAQIRLDPPGAIAAAAE